MAQLREGSVIKKSTGDEVIATVNDIPEIPTSLPADGGNADTVGGFTVGTNVPANAKFTDTVYTHPSSHNIAEVSGLQTALNEKQSALGYTPVNKSGDTVTGELAVVNDSVRNYLRLKRSTSGANAAEFWFSLGYGRLSIDSSAGQYLCTLSEDGKFGIGVTSQAAPTQKLDVNGKIRMRTQTAAADGDDIVATKKYVDDGLDSKVNNSRVLTDVPINAKFTDTTYSEMTTAEIDAGTSSTLRTITGRRIKYILDKVQGWINSLTKADVGLSNVDNVKQASKSEFDTHNSDSIKHITSTERSNWNAKETVSGAQSKANAAESSAKSYVDGKVLTNVPLNAKFTDTIYTHPSSHPASMITESATKRFVSDTEKTNWSNKWDYNESTIKAVKVNNASNADTVNGKTVAENVPVGAKFTDTIYTHPTSAGNKHVPSGGSSGQFLKWASNGTAVWDSIPGGLELGETSGTAYRGDRGRIAYNHSQSEHAPLVHVGSVAPSDNTAHWIDTSL